jgi:hypothetical protein
MVDSEYHFKQKSKTVLKEKNVVFPMPVLRLEFLKKLEHKNNLKECSKFEIIYSKNILFKGCIW